MTLTTYEELKILASSDNANELTRRLARECLANREAQPVAYMYKDNIHADARFSLYKRFGNWSQEDINEYEITEIPLYTAPPAPAAPDGYQHLKNVQELYHKQEERLFALAQRIKGASFDKYSHSTEQAIDVLEREIFGEDDSNCRVATLANRATRPQQSITDAIDRIVTPLSPEGLDEEKHHCEWHLYHDRERIIKELREYFSEQPTGEEQNEVEIGHDSYPDYVAGWNACRAAMLAQPVSSGYKLPDGWIACSEQTPVADGAYWCWFGKEKPSVIQQRVCIWNDRNHEWCDSAVTHWMPLPAEPEGRN